MSVYGVQISYCYFVYKIHKMCTSRQLCIEAEWCIHASSNLAIIGSDNGLLPDRRQAIIWSNDGILLTGPWGTNFNEILIKIQKFSYKKMALNMSSGKWQPFLYFYYLLFLGNWGGTSIGNGCQGTVYHVWSIPWLVITSAARVFTLYPGIFRFQHQKDRTYLV